MDTTTYETKEFADAETALAASSAHSSPPDRGTLGRLRLRMREGSKAFLLSWSGGREIAMTQHGSVYDARNAIIGTYERLLDNGGESVRDQRMLVFVI